MARVLVLELVVFVLSERLPVMVTWTTVACLRRIVGRLLRLLLSIPRWSISTWVWTLMMLIAAGDGILLLWLHVSVLRMITLIAALWSVVRRSLAIVRVHIRTLPLLRSLILILLKVALITGRILLRELLL